MSAPDLTAGKARYRMRIQSTTEALKHAALWLRIMGLPIQEAELQKIIASTEAHMQAHLTRYDNPEGDSDE